MKITFFGATHEVTGSCTLIQTGKHNILIDCGMEQGKDIFENKELPINPSEIECVLLTHAHIDHSGKLPLLTKNGFCGSIYTTEATSNLCKIMLEDSAHIQMLEAEWKNRKSKRADTGEVLPMYDIEDAENTIKYLIPCDYGKKIQILENVFIRFNDIGHLLGSAAIEVWITESDVTKKIVFSGDVGNTNQPIICDPKPIKNADYLVIESTYGNRLHGQRYDYISKLTSYIQHTFDRGGNIVIPSFAVGRTQEILYFIRQIKQNNLVKGHGGFPVYVDSPLANEATGIFMQCHSDYFDDETKKLIKSGINPIYFEGLKTTTSSDESKAINSDTIPKIIISASGMCEAGRIRHHLKHNLWRKENLILFVGYQAEGTLGRSLIDGAENVKIFGESITVNAEIAVLEGVSGHADKNGLLNWINYFEKKPDMIFVNHGDDESCTSFSNCLISEYGYNAIAPYSGTIYNLLENKMEYEAESVYIKKTSRKANEAKTSFNRLLSTIAQLEQTAKRFDGMANKDIAKFASQIDSLNEKWKHWLDS